LYGDAAQGIDVVVSSSDAARCRSVAEEIAGRHGVRAFGIAADVFDPAAMDTLFDAAVQALGGVDIVVINYPGPALGTAVGIDTQVLEQHFRGMVISPIRLMQRALPAMRERRWGRIVSVGGRAMHGSLPNKVMDNTLRPAFFNGLDGSGTGTAVFGTSGSPNTTNRDLLINSLISKAVGTGLDAQVRAAEVRAEMTGYTEDPLIDDDETYETTGLINRLVSGPTGASASGGRTVMKAACGAVLGSGATLIQ
jgi:3-oxoacyl-[acyl-carrier protein] reductase